jgi:hypothetical protein
LIHPIKSDSYHEVSKAETLTVAREVLTELQEAGFSPPESWDILHEAMRVLVTNGIKGASIR